MTPWQRKIVLVSCATSILGWIGFLRLETNLPDSGLYGMVLMTLWIAPVILYLAFQPSHPVRLQDTFLGSVWIYPLLAAATFLMQASLNDEKLLPETLADFDLRAVLGLIPALFSIFKLSRKSGR